MDFFIVDKWELYENLRTIERVLFNLKLNLTQLFAIMYSLFPENSKFRKDLKKTKELFKNDLITQLKKFKMVSIRQEFMERWVFFWKNLNTRTFLMVVPILKSKIFYYDIKKILILKKFINNKFFSIKKIFTNKIFF